MATRPRRVMMRPFLALAVLVAANACAPNPNAPTSMTGTWVGTVVSSVLGNVASQLTLTQSGSAITGEYTSTVPGQATSGGGTLTGTVQGSSFTATLPTGPCIRTWTGTWSGLTLSGTYVATGSCGVPDQGTFNLTLE